MDEMPMRDERLVNVRGPVPTSESADRESAPVGALDETSVGEPPLPVRNETPVARPAHLFPADLEGASLSDEEIALYRRRVAEGFYNTREVASEVARRMIRRGDV